MDQSDMTIEQFIAGCHDVGWGVNVNFSPDGHMGTSEARWCVTVYKHNPLTGEQRVGFGKTWGEARDSVLPKAFRPTVFPAGSGWEKPPELVALETETARELAALRERWAPNEPS